MGDINRVEVVINGKTYRLMGVESEAYIKDIACYIDNKMAEVNKSKSSHGLGGDLSTILIAINIADDLFKEREISKSISGDLAEEREISKKIQTDLAKEKENLKKIQADLLKEKEKSKKLQNEILHMSTEFSKTRIDLEKAKKELAEYIETFETKSANKNQK